MDFHVHATALSRERRNQTINSNKKVNMYIYIFYILCYHILIFQFTQSESVHICHISAHINFISMHSGPIMLRCARYRFDPVRSQFVASISESPRHAHHRVRSSGRSSHALTHRIVNVERCGVVCKNMCLLCFQHCLTLFDIV